MLTRRSYATELMAASRQIVVVEDVFVRTFLRAALERMGYRVVCPNPAEAVRLLSSGEIDLLVTNTPGEFSDFGATVPLLYIAAFPDPSCASAFQRWLPLHKPFQSAELASAVQRLLEAE
jgi:hypothetical protein